jgi:hypothetical protein
VIYGADSADKLLITETGESQAQETGQARNGWGVAKPYQVEEKAVHPTGKTEMDPIARCYEDSCSSMYEYTMNVS